MCGGQGFRTASSPWLGNSRHASPLPPLSLSQVLAWLLPHPLLCGRPSRHGPLLSQLQHTPGQLQAALSAGKICSEGGSGWVTSALLLGCSQCYAFCLLHVSVQEDEKFFTPTFLSPNSVLKGARGGGGERPVLTGDLYWEGAESIKYCHKMSSCEDTPTMDAPSGSFLVLPYCLLPSLSTDLSFKMLVFRLPRTSVPFRAHHTTMGEMQTKIWPLLYSKL